MYLHEIKQEHDSKVQMEEEKEEGDKIAIKNPLEHHHQKKDKEENQISKGIE